MVTLVAVGDLLPTEVNLHLRHKGSFKTFPMEPLVMLGGLLLSVEKKSKSRLGDFIDGTLEDGRLIALFRGDENPWRVAVKGGSRGKGWTARVGGFLNGRTFILQNQTTTPIGMHRWTLLIASGKTCNSR